MCKNCNSNPIYEFTNKRKLCKSCFVKYFEKKILYTIRKFQLIEKKDRIFIEKKDKTLNYVFEKFNEKFPLVEIVKSKQKSNKIALSDNLDCVAENITKSVIENINKLKTLSPKTKLKNKIVIKPFYLLSEKEIQIYSRLKNIKTTNSRHKKAKVISDFLDETEKTNPEIKHSIVNNYLDLLKKLN